MTITSYAKTWPKTYLSVYKNAKERGYKNPVLNSALRGSVVNYLGQYGDLSKVTGKNDIENAIITEQAVKSLMPVKGFDAVMGNVAGGFVYGGEKGGKLLHRYGEDPSKLKEISGSKIKKELTNLQSELKTIPKVREKASEITEEGLYNALGDAAEPLVDVLKQTNQGKKIVKEGGKIGRNLWTAGSQFKEGNLYEAGDAAIKAGKGVSRIARSDLAKKIFGL